MMKWWDFPSEEGSIRFCWRVQDLSDFEASVHSSLDKLSSLLGVMSHKSRLRD
jgi:hypothetical protein